LEQCLLYALMVGPAVTGPFNGICDGKVTGSQPGKAAVIDGRYIPPAPILVGQAFQTLSVQSVSTP